MSEIWPQPPKTKLRTCIISFLIKIWISMLFMTNPLFKLPKSAGIRRSKKKDWYTWWNSPGNCREICIRRSLPLSTAWVLNIIISAWLFGYSTTFAAVSFLQNWQIVFECICNFRLEDILQFGVCQKLQNLCKLLRIYVVIRFVCSVFLSTTARLRISSTSWWARLTARTAFALKHKKIIIAKVTLVGSIQ